MHGIHSFCSVAALPIPALLAPGGTSTHRATPRPTWRTDRPPGFREIRGSRERSPAMTCTREEAGVKM
ncbi:hypothetical protein D187_008998 [Cystobacter fuscus DSM 2262]|uniref:Uncharacterized protein n=1 Tax=Cystobacter fuscus (strain ATCC 25194 / DSM 2262 / NBRC 100088 / M29) TaxID=1242864 RepID=S9NZD2_CYSF2|nr:hypothetical protein D187_008998 [Cystobacter fuscus DSM 2262]